MAMMTIGSAYHTLSGMGRGIGLTRHGKSALLPQLRPMIAPSNVNGKHKKIQMAAIANYID